MGIQLGHHLVGGASLEQVHLLGCPGNFRQQVEHQVLVGASRYKHNRLLEALYCGKAGLWNCGGGVVVELPSVILADKLKPVRDSLKIGQGGHYISSLEAVEVHCGGSNQQIPPVVFPWDKELLGQYLLLFAVQLYVALLAVKPDLFIFAHIVAREPDWVGRSLVKELLAVFIIIVAKSVLILGLALVDHFLVVRIFLH